MTSKSVLHPAANMVGDKTLESSVTEYNATKQFKTKEDEMNDRLMVIKASTLVYASFQSGPYVVARIINVDKIRWRCYLRFEDDITHWCHFKDLQKNIRAGEGCCLCGKLKQKTAKNLSAYIDCKTCGMGFHRHCHSPVVALNESSLSNEEWICRVCLYKKTGEKNDIFFKQKNPAASLSTTSMLDTTRNDAVSLIYNAIQAIAMTSISESNISTESNQISNNLPAQNQKRKHSNEKRIKTKKRKKCDYGNNDADFSASLTSFPRSSRSLRKTRKLTETTKDKSQGDSDSISSSRSSSLESLVCLDPVQQDKGDTAEESRHSTDLSSSEEVEEGSSVEESDEGSDSEINELMDRFLNRVDCSMNSTPSRQTEENFAPLGSFVSTVVESNCNSLAQNPDNSQERRKTLPFSIRNSAKDVGGKGGSVASSASPISKPKKPNISNNRPVNTSSSGTGNIAVPVAKKRGRPRKVDILERLKSQQESTVTLDQGSKASDKKEFLNKKPAELHKQASKLIIRKNYPEQTSLPVNSQKDLMKSSSASVLKGQRNSVEHDPDVESDEEPPTLAAVSPLDPRKSGRDTQPDSQSNHPRETLASKLSTKRVSLSLGDVRREIREQKQEQEKMCGDEICDQSPEGIVIEESSDTSLFYCGSHYDMNDTSSILVPNGTPSKDFVTKPSDDVVSKPGPKNFIFGKRLDNQFELGEGKSGHKGKPASLLNGMTKKSQATMEMFGKKCSSKPSKSFVKLAKKPDTNHIGEMSKEDVLASLTVPKNVVEKSLIESICKKNPDEASLKRAMVDYFGSSSRIESGEECKVVGLRVDSSGKLQYLVEWEDGSVRK